VRARMFPQTLSLPHTYVLAHARTHALTAPTHTLTHSRTHARTHTHTRLSAMHWRVDSPLEATAGHTLMSTRSATLADRAHHCAHDPKAPSTTCTGDRKESRFLIRAQLQNRNDSVSDASKNGRDVDGCQSGRVGRCVHPHRQFVIDAPAICATINDVYVYVCLFVCFYFKYDEILRFGLGACATHNHATRIYVWCDLRSRGGIILSILSWVAGLLAF
jgi:hypothetical protein